MIIMIKEEDNMYNLVSISEETKYCLLDAGATFTEIPAKKIGDMTLAELITTMLPNLRGISSRVMTPGTKSDTTQAMAIEYGTYGELNLYVLKLSTPQMFLAYDNADDYSVGDVDEIEYYVRKNFTRKIYATA